jgi:hypothetical protein
METALAKGSRSNKSLKEGQMFVQRGKAAKLHRDIVIG